MSRLKTQIQKSWVNMIIILLFVISSLSISGKTSVVLNDESDSNPKNMVSLKTNPSLEDKQIKLLSGYEKIISNFQKILRRLSLVMPAGMSAQGAAESERVRAPLPLEVAVSLHRHNFQSPVNLSPDGQWIAHTVATDETVPRGKSSRYSDSGFPFSEGSARMQATLSRSGSGEQINLGGPEFSSWAPVWSPDGSRVAFYSDEGREAGLWVWERDTGKKRRISDAIVRPAFGFETPRWSPDGNRILVKVLPAGRSLAEANAFAPAPTTDPEVPEVRKGEASVIVRLSKAAEDERDAADADQDEPSQDPIDRSMQVFAADLAIVDVRTGQVRRIVENTMIRSYTFSPDERYVAYAVWTGWDVNVEQNLFDIRLLELETKLITVLGKDLPLGSIGFGNEWSWSPDGRRLAYVAGGDFTVVSLPSGDTHKWEDRVPTFDPEPPIWSVDGKRLFAVADAALWSLDLQTGEGKELARIDGWDIRKLITPTYLSPVAWMKDGRLWVTARERDGMRSGIYSVDPTRGATKPHLQETKSYGGVHSLAASDVTGEIVFLSYGHQELEDLWLFDSESGLVRRGSRINEALLNYELGTTRLIRWRSAIGEELGGALLLPPGYESPDRLPLIVYVYGGDRGSETVNHFGLLGPGPTYNMHILATRGYAVLYPDAPLRTGRTIEDLVGTVLPGVDAAIEAGYADPERLALMGHSYGAENVLALLTRTDRFGAALIDAAVSHPDLFAHYVRNPGHFEQGQGDMGGTIWEYPERYWANSPLFNFPRIETPLLICQGDQDGDLVASKAIFTALERLGKFVEYRVYGGEDHVISRPANVIDLWKRRLAFLSEHLDLSVGHDGRVKIR